MILAGHQPEYLPYIGLFHKILLCDTFIFVDHVQFNKKSWQNRNKIRCNKGEMLLTVPVLTKTKFDQKIAEVRINNDLDWGKKHWLSIYFNYKNASHFEEYKDFFENIYNQKRELLGDLNESIIRYIIKKLKINIKVVKSSDFDLTSKKTDLLIEMCKALNADTYLSGSGGRGYVDNEKFKKNNLRSLFTDFTHPVYTQQFSPFIPNMSVVDLLFNCGSDASKGIMEECGGIVE